MSRTIQRDAEDLILAREELETAAALSSPSAMDQPQCSMMEEIPGSLRRIMCEGGFGFVRGCIERSRRRETPRRNVRGE